MNNLSILRQVIARLKAKSPKLFQVITTISAIAAFVTGIPELLDMFGIVLPDFLAGLANKAVAISSTVVAIISALTVDTPTATTTVLKQIDDGVKPAEAKKAA